jgi:hypothetical protein
MQTAANRKSQGPMTNRVNRMVGVGMALGFIALGSVSAISCNPGALPECPQEGDDRDRIDCWGGGDGGPAGGAGGGGAGGSTGGSGGMTAMGGAGGGTGMMVSATTAVAGCDKFNTLGGADAFFKMRCGTGTSCHPVGLKDIWQDFESANAFSRLLNRDAKVTCIAGKGKIIDGTDHTKSILLLKTKDAMPKCADGATAGELMPPQSMSPMGMYPALSAAEKTCIENFVKAAAGK